MRKWFLFVVLTLALGGSALAQDPAAFPTVGALNEAVVPPRDLIDLSQRLQGLTTIAPPPVNPAPLTVGTVQTFWVDNSFEDRSFQVQAELKVVGAHIYLWVQEGEDVSIEGLQRLADEFDTQVYAQVRALWGSETSPGVDGDPRVHGLFARDLGMGIAAYFASKHTYPVEAVPTSNAREMFFFNLDAVENLIGEYALTSITAHEFQHMIRANVDANEDGWMDEGFSQFTQFYLGDTDLFAVAAFQSNPNTQLNTWTENGNRTADYGASQMWVTYLYERFGEAALNTLSADPANGMVGVQNVAEQNGTTANDLFADWGLANLILDPDNTPEGIYGYRSLSGLRGMRQTTYDALPITETLSVNQYAAAYLALNVPAAATALNIRVDAPGVVGLAPMQSPTGTPMWYSNRGDDSNTRLTLPVDLTNTQNPVLAFDLWYHIERLWDYGYVMISTDGGTTWAVLQSDEMTTENPHFTAYGAGYTGTSGGDQSTWVSEQISLADYAGQQVLLRFEMIYDDAVNRPGMFIDSVNVTDTTTGATIYQSTFADASQLDDWTAEGWLLTDNRLPQQVWVQAVEYIGNENRVTRWLLAGSTGEYTLPLSPDADRVVLVLAPFAPTTTVPAEITVNVQAQ